MTALTTTYRIENIGSSPFSFWVLCDIQHCGPSLSASVSPCTVWRVLSLHSQMQLCLRCWPGPARPTLPSSQPGLVCGTMTHKHTSQRRPLPEFHTHPPSARRRSPGTLRTCSVQGLCWAPQATGAPGLQGAQEEMLGTRRKDRPHWLGIPRKAALRS